LSLAALDGVEVNEELCHLACLVHDIAAAEPTPGRCYAVVRAERAKRFALEHDETRERASAIAAHITVRLKTLARPAVLSPLARSSISQAPVSAN
jgi:HD superfamily phosphodiesterase